MIKKTKPQQGFEELHVVKNAGFKETKKVKRDKSVNRRAGLHDKLKNLKGEVRVKRRKPLGLKHVRRMRKFAAVAAVGAVGAIAVVGVGFFSPKKTTELNQDFQTVCFTAPSDGTKPTDHTLVENVGYLNYVLQNQEYWSSEMFSTVISLGFSQTVETYKQYYDDVLISADVAKGFSSKATQFCVANGVVMWRPSANKDFDKMNTPWSTGEAQAMTVNTYKMNRGFPPSEFSVYVLNELTIANAAEYSVTDNGDGTYAMTLNLNVNTGEDETSADYYYKLQMKVTGDLYDCPTIHSTSVTYVFDENWRILEFEISDSYNAPIAANFAPSCTSNTKVKFDYGEENAVNSFWKDYFSSEYDRVKDSLVDGAKEEENTDNAMGYLSGAFASVLTEGAVFNVGLNIDDLNLNGVVSVEMENSSFSGLSAKLGDILVWLDGETLYVNDGASKYKLDIGGLLSSGEEGEDGGDLLGGFDVAALMDEMTQGTFILNEETGVATLNSEVELFGLTVPMEFEFQKAQDGGVELNFLKAEIPLGEKVVKAKLSFGTENDKPAIPTDTAAYQDILNDGITLDISLNLNGFTLDGLAKIIMQNGAFAGVYAKLDDITVYYDYPHNMLYLSKGSVKYSLDTSTLGTGDADLPSTLGSLEINSLLTDVLANLSTSETSLGTSLDINIDALGTALKAALDIRLFGGLKVDAGLKIDNLNLTVSAALSNEKVTLPDVEDYQDILNTTITFDVSLTLMTGLTDEATGIRDGAVLEGKVALCLKDGAVKEIRADFGGLAVYFDFTSKSLYLKVGTTKVTLNLNEMDLTDTAILSSLGGSEIIPVDLPDAIKQLLTNLIGDGKTISTNADLTLFNAFVPVSAELDLSEGISASVELSILGVDAVATVALSEDTLEALSDEAKEEYVDVLKEGHKIVESLIGDHISATVKGSLYTGDEIKYTFKAALEYDKGTVSVDEDGTEVDSKAYIHLNIGLTAKQPADDSLYIDLVLMDANPIGVDANGKTTGGYTKDGNYDVYLSVSKYEQSTNALQIYAPVDEILTLVSMVGAMANLDLDQIEIKAENRDEIITAIAQISGLLDDMLISKYLPKSVQDKFASLGDSLIPQILGVSLEELLSNLFGNVDSTVKDVEKSNFLLSDKYVSSIKTTDESLIFVLNSSLIYNNESIDNLTVEFTRLNKDGVYYVGGVNLDNIYFGENLSNKLNLGLQLGYDEIIRPDANKDLKGYLNADGLDTLVNGLINSATHKVEGTEDEYDLNHYYLLQGSVTAKINIIGLKLKEAEIQIKSLAVYIDQETNNVSLDAHIYYDSVGMVGQVVIDGKADVYLSMHLGSNQGGGDIIIRKVKYTQYEGWSEKKLSTPSVEVRSMTLEEFSNNMMDNIIFILSLGPTVTERLDGAGNNSGSGVNFDGFDYGQYLDAILAYYVSEQTSTGASWTIAINGGLLTSLIGMTTSNIPLKFSADLNEDGSYTVRSLQIIKSNLTLVNNVVDLDFWGSFTYCNPNEQIEEGYTDSSDDLFNMDVTVTSEYDLKYTDSSFKWACGSYVKLPIGVSVTLDGLSHIISGYTATTQYGTNNVQFEGYVEEDGVRYGLVTLKSDTEYTAIWSKAYTVSFTDENGKELYSVIYRENDVLNFGNMPECPELEGYTVQWVDKNGTPANGTAVTGDTSFKLEYVKTPLKVKLNSTVEFNYAGYDGTYKSLPVGFEEGSDYVVADATAEGYTFVGWWYNDNGNWRQVTSVSEFVDAGSVTLEALWLKADISCTSSRDDYREGWAQTLYYRYTFESEVSYHFEGTYSLIENINCTKTSYTMHLIKDKSSSDYPYNFDGYQSKLEKQTVVLKDSWGSAKYGSWNMVVTLTFTLPDGSVWSTPQTGAFSLTGNY
ncbi:MAG: hypothetical protein K2O28_04125 [Clostridia bacterium]|nr:hypothetical protein [Clostridia bacterium]